MSYMDPIQTCLQKHGSNSTLGFHECLCQHDYSHERGGLKKLKIKHCYIATEMMKMDNFYSYIIGGAVAIVLIVGTIAAICSFKWYMETKNNPCSCCGLFCCCKKCGRKRKRPLANESINVFEHSDTGHTWSPVNLPPNREGETTPASMDESKDESICMNFCLSDPVQDCCEFFDCDIMWRKKSIYTIPIFGRKKQHHHLQRRPSRPAPPPPKAVVLPQIKSPEPATIYEDEECEPVPEAPPSPEPIRTIPPKAMYVDPLAFLHSTFKNAQTEKKEPKDSDETDSRQEPLYSKFKNVVGLISKVKKSVSMASLNKLGISSDPNGVSTHPSGPSNNKKMKTASLASLNNLGDGELDASYGSKRSLSLASLHMLQEQNGANGILDPRSRTSVLSTVSTATDDIPPSARKDEYIDLEEMSKRIEAKMQAARSLGVSPVPSPHPPISDASHKIPQTSSVPYTPNFMPASAYIGASKPVQHFASDVSRNQPEMFINEKTPEVKHFSPIPASHGRPAIPARTSFGASSYSGSPSGTMNRPKPAVPPRPPTGEAARVPSPQTASLPRSPRLVKPSGPPPPPPTGNKIPIESSI